jgi:hypothetical protein
MFRSGVCRLKTRARGCVADCGSAILADLCAQPTRIDRVSPLKYCSQIAKTVTQGGLTMRTSRIPTPLGEMGGRIAGGKGFQTMRTAPHICPGDCDFPKYAGARASRVGLPSDPQGSLWVATPSHAVRAEAFSRNSLVLRQVATRPALAMPASRDTPTGLSAPVGRFRCDWTFSLVPAGQ